MTFNPVRVRIRRIILGTIGVAIIAFLLGSCQKEAHSSANVTEDIRQLHAKLHDAGMDSTSLLLDKLDLVQSRGAVPDSLFAQSLYYRGRYLNQLGMLDSAATLLHHAVSLVRPPIGKEQAEYFRMVWSIYYTQGKYGECLALSNTLESLLGANGTPKQKALLYFIRENAYRQQGNFVQAADYNARLIKQLELAEDMEGLASALMSKAYYAYYVDENVDSAFVILKALVDESSQYTHNTNSLIHGDYGIYLFNEGQYHKALSSYKKGLAEVHRIPDGKEQNVSLATAYSNIAEAYMELGYAWKAQEYLDSVYNLGLNNLPENIRNNTLRYQLKLIYSDRQGLQPILNVLDSILWYQDQQFLERNQSELRALQLANEKEKDLLKKNKEEELTNLRLRLGQVILLVVFVIIALIGYLLYRQRQLRFEKQELQLHQRLLRAQMNPHFTFNTLYAIQTLIKKDPQEAIAYQLKLSRLLRLILENSTANFVLLDDELIAIEQYLELQLLRFPGKFEYEVLLEGVERNDPIFIPPMLIQPMIENCIEHGFAGISYTGFIGIRLSARGSDALLCTIEDNGVGLRTGGRHLSQATSTELIDAFLKKLTSSGLMTSNKADQGAGENGVLVEFFIPLKTTKNG